jgi:hypothetical protein
MNDPEYLNKKLQLSGENEDGMTDAEMYDLYENDFDGESIDDQD